MVSVTIGLTDPRLLKWFNEFHAALLKADSAKPGTGELMSTKEKMLIKKSNALQDLIPVTEAILHSMREEFADIIRSIGSLGGMHKRQVHQK